MAQTNQEFIEQAKKFLKLAPASTTKFWTGISEKASSYYWALKLFDILSKPSKRQQYLPNTTDAMLSSIFILEYFSNVTAKNPETVKNSRARLQEEGDIKSSNVKWIMELYLESCSEAVLVKGFIRRLAGLPDIVEQTEKPTQVFEREKINNRKPPRVFKAPYQQLKGVYDPQDNIELTYTYIGFLDFLVAKNLNAGQAIYEEIAKSLRLLQNASKSLCLQVTNGILSLLWLLQNLMRFHMLPYTKTLKQFMILTDCLKRMPAPVGQLANQVMKMLYAELKTFGYNYRTTLRVHIPNLDNIQEKNIDLQAYLVRKDETIFHKDEFCSPDTVRKCIMSNIIATCYKSDVEIMNRIKALPEQVAFSYYGKMLRVIDITQQLDHFQDIKTIRTKSLEEIVAALNKQRQDQVNPGKKQIDLLLQNEQYRNFEFPQFEIACIDLNSFVGKMSHRNFKGLLLSKSNELPYHKQRLRIVFEGSDSEFRRLVQTMSEVYYEQHKEFTDLQLFILPSKKQKLNLAVYLAHRDIWYSRFVYNAFRQDGLFPQFVAEAQTKDTLPYFLQNKTIQMYLRQASRFLNVHVFRATIKFSLISKPPQTIFFCQYILMGVSAYVEVHRKMKGKYQNLDFLELYVEKIKSADRHIQDFSCNMEVQVCDAEGKELGKRTDQRNVKIHDLKIVHLPYEYFLGDDCHPYNNYLQLSFLSQINSKVFEKQISNKSLFSKYETNVTYPFKTLFSGTSFTYLKLDVLQKSTRVVIDGQMFEDVESITISNSFGIKKQKDFTIPIKTFLPFQF